MKQPIKGKRRKSNSKNQKPRSNPFKKRHYGNKDYGTSKLELDFARNFLEKLKLKYVYQFEARDIKRFYDFAVTVYDDYPFKYEVKDGLNCIVQPETNITISILIEVDGDYYHSNPDKVDENKLNPMQKHNKFVDNLKNEWALKNGIPLLRFWENDIRNNPSKVYKAIEKAVKAARKKKLILEEKKKPH